MVIQAEGEIYWETKSILSRFGSNEPSLGVWGMISVILKHRWMFKKLYKIRGKNSIYYIYSLFFPSCFFKFVSSLSLSLSLSLCLSLYFFWFEIFSDGTYNFYIIFSPNHMRIFKIKCIFSPYCRIIIYYLLRYIYIYICIYIYIYIYIYL